MSLPRRGNGRGALSLLFLCGALAALLCAAAAFCPPYEGDAYEYGEVALRWVRHGDMLERHLRSYTIPGQNPEHIAAQRANYYTVFLAPFAAVFHDNFRTVFLPGLLGAISIALVVFAAGRKLFDARTAWWAALLCLFNPRIIYQTLLDPTPEMWLATLCFVSACLFARKKYALSGAALGIAMFVKQSAVALLPAYLIYLLLFDRGELKKKTLWLGFAAFIVAASPFLIRNTVLFHNPVYTEEMSARRHFDPRALRDGNILRTLFERGGDSSDTYAAEDKTPVLAKTFSLIDKNFKDNVIGARYIDYYPGFLPLIFVACVPLLAAGLWFGRGSPAVRLFALCILCYIIFQTLFVVAYETRYIFPLIPFGAVIAAYGAFELGRRVKKFRPEAALLFALITGSFTTLPLMALQTTSRDGRVQALEYISVCKYLKAAAPPQSTVMAWPPYSSVFYSDLRTVPYVYGDLARQVRVIKKYHVDYVIFNDLIFDGEPPAIDFLTPVAKGRFISLYKVAPGAAGYAEPESVYAGIAGYNPLESVFRRSQDFDVRLDWPVEAYLARILPGKPYGAAAIMIAAFVLFHYLITRKSRAARIASVAVLIVACFGAKVAFFIVTGFKPMPPPTPVNLAQLRSSAGPDVDSIVILGNPALDSDYAKAMAGVFRKVKYSTSPAPPAKNEIMFVPIRERFGALTTQDLVAGWGYRKNAIKMEAAGAAELAVGLGLLPVRVGGGMALVPPVKSPPAPAFAFLTSRRE